MRYGYLITDKELVVFRIGPADDRIPHSSQKELRQAVAENSIVEWQSIPWENHGDSKLTVNLALWVLHILAANNGLLDWEYKELAEETIMDFESQQKLTTSFSTEEAQSQQRTQQMSSATSTTDELQTSQNATQDSFTRSFASNQSHTSNTSTKRKRPSKFSFSGKRQKKAM
jgi:hypothetical protein